MKIERRAFTLFQLLVVLALLASCSPCCCPAWPRCAWPRPQPVAEQPEADWPGHPQLPRRQRAFPPGNDDNNFSAAAYLLPYIEQQNSTRRSTSRSRWTTRPTPPSRKTVIKMFLRSTRPGQVGQPDYGPTNYLFSAGSKPALEDNDGIFYQNSKVRIADITDGTSNTCWPARRSRATAASRRRPCKRQHVRLKKDALKGLKDDAGVKDLKNDKNIAADRCASWMDGRFLQGTFTGTRTSTTRSPTSTAPARRLVGLAQQEDNVNIVMADGSVRAVTAKVKLETWKLLADKADGNPLPADF